MKGEFVIFCAVLLLKLIAVLRPELLAMARSLKGSGESHRAGSAGGDAPDAPKPDYVPDGPKPDDVPDESPPAEPKIELTLWFLREGDVLRRYVEERWKGAPPLKLPQGRVPMPGPYPEVLGCVTFCEVIDEQGQICGFYGAIYTDENPGSGIELTLHECANCRIIDGEYLIALGETMEDIDEVERRFRLGGDALSCSCGFEESIILSDGTWAMTAVGWFDWRDREQRILAYESRPECTFSRPVPILER